jgi:hypothetical protein
MDLTARLKYLLNLYSAAFDHGAANAARLRAQLCKELEPLIAQYGQGAVIAALDKLPEERRPSGTLH